MFFYKILFFEIFFIGSMRCQNKGNLAIEQSLINAIFTGYQKTVRPDYTVDIAISVAIKQITSIDEKNQIMTSSLYVFQDWYDDRLKWNPSNYTDIEEVVVPLKNLWIPDTFIINSVEGDGYFKINSDFGTANVESDGHVFYSSPFLSLKTRCSLNVINYPFDSQKCLIKLTSWGYEADRVNYNLNYSKIDLSDYTKSTIWDLINTDLNIVEAKFAFGTNPNSIITIDFFLKRKSLFYMINHVFPCLLLNIVTLLLFFLPFANQIALGMTGFLTFSVYSVRIASDIPVQSDYLPKISWYFLTSITYNLLAMSWFILRNNFTTKGKIPKCFEIICEQFEKIFLKKKEKKINKTAPVDVEKQASDESVKVVEIKKCNFCNRCETCEAEIKKNQEKSSVKQSIDNKLEAFNYFYFIVITVVMLITQLSIWLSVS